MLSKLASPSRIGVHSAAAQHRRSRRIAIGCGSANDGCQTYRKRQWDWSIKYDSLSRCSLRYRCVFERLDRVKQRRNRDGDDQLRRRSSSIRRSRMPYVVPIFGLLHLLLQLLLSVCINCHEFFGWHSSFVVFNCALLCAVCIYVGTRYHRRRAFGSETRVLQIR